MRRVIYLLLIVVWLCGCTAAGPEQPEFGFDPSDYPHRSVAVTVYGEERSGRRFWIFEPDAPRPVSAPLIVFNHGWMNKTPRKHRAWIEHLVRRGNIVVYPRFQEGTFGDPAYYLPNTLYAIGEAVRILETESFRVKPDKRRVACVGYSIGGLLNMSQAATAKQAGLPQPRAVFNAAPGNTWIFPMEDPADIPADVLMVNVYGDADVFVGDTDAVKFMTETPQIPAERKWLVELPSDYHSFPPLIADHNALLGVHQRSGDPIGRTFPVNAHDYGLWRMCDALLEAAFENKPFDIRPLLDLGRWSDGKPVKPLILIDSTDLN